MNRSAFKLKIILAMAQPTVTIKVCHFYTGVPRNTKGNSLCQYRAKLDQPSERSLFRGSWKKLRNSK